MKTDNSESQYPSRTKRIKKTLRLPREVATKLKLFCDADSIDEQDFVAEAIESHLGRHIEEGPMRGEYDFSEGQRGRYVARIKPGDTDPRNCKVRVSISLDADIVQRLKQGTMQSGTSFEVQINDILREHAEPTEQPRIRSSLIDDDRFIAAIAKRVAKQLRQSK
ncbi:MAG: hypothetical protein AABN33_17860 [Acidobacteriota bacterium]